MNQDNMEQKPPVSEEKGGAGPVIGIIIIIAILVLGAWYFWGNRDSAPEVSESDEVSAIEEDLEAGAIEEDGELEEELDSIEAELDAEIEAMESETAE